MASWQDEIDDEKDKVSKLGLDCDTQNIGDENGGEFDNERTKNAKTRDEHTKDATSYREGTWNNIFGSGGRN